MEADSWAEPRELSLGEYAWLTGARAALGFEGCEELPFSPEIESPESARRRRAPPAHPTGLTVNVKVPQQTTLEAGEARRGRRARHDRDAARRRAAVPLGGERPGSVLRGPDRLSRPRARPGSARLHERQASCPDGSKVGIVHIKTPLSEPRTGRRGVSGHARRRTAKRGRTRSTRWWRCTWWPKTRSSGVLVKLAGEGTLDEGTLQVSHDVQEHAAGAVRRTGARTVRRPTGVAVDPAVCGSYATEAAFTPWSGTGTVELRSPAARIRRSPRGRWRWLSGGALPFAPGFDAQSTNTQAGAFTGVRCWN